MVLLMAKEAQELKFDDTKATLATGLIYQGKIAQEILKMVANYKGTVPVKNEIHSLHDLAPVDTVKNIAQAQIGLALLKTIDKPKKMESV